MNVWFIWKENYNYNVCSLLGFEENAGTSAKKRADLMVLEARCACVLWATSPRQADSRPSPRKTNKTDSWEDLSGNYLDWQVAEN